MREQFSLNIAWLGQHLVVAGYFGGAVRRDCSVLRQSPRLSHGGDKQVSFSAGTHTSLSLHSCTAELPSAIQFGNPHHRLEHFVSFFSPQRQELQRFDSNTTDSSLEKEHLGGEFESTEWMRRERKKKRKMVRIMLGKFKLSLVMQHNEVVIISWVHWGVKCLGQARGFR